MRGVFRPRVARIGLRVAACAAVAAVALVAPGPAGAGVSAPRAYATALFARVPLPPGAQRLTTPLTPLGPIGATFAADDVHLVRYYVVASSLSVSAFAQSHFARREFEGSSTTNGQFSSTAFSAMSLCANPHAAFCGVTYSVLSLSGGRQELRVDVDVVWKALNTVRLPGGVVTLTGYRTISLMNASAGAVTVTLTASQASRLRADIAGLRTSPGGMCMEDSLLYKISVTSSSGAVIWSATADECPGALVVTTPQGHATLNDRSCGLDALVASLLPADRAAGSRSGLKVCQSAY